MLLSGVLPLVKLEVLHGVKNKHLNAGINMGPGEWLRLSNRGGDESLRGGRFRDDAGY